MKLSFDEFNYYLPEQEKVLVINESEDSFRLLNKLNEYFAKNKKNACKVVSDDGERIFSDDFEFIYYPWNVSIDSNYQFKTKSFFNDYLSDQIRKDETHFATIEQIRNDLRELITDHGMYNLLKAITNGLNNNINYSINNFDVSNIIANLELEFDCDSEIDRLLGVYNLAFNANQEKLLIVYLDAPITDYLMSWLNAVISDNKIFILSGELNSNQYVRDLCFYICRNTFVLHKEDIEYKEFIALKYMFNPFVLRNSVFQTSNNIELFKEYDDNSINFLLKVNNPDTQSFR